MGSAGGACCTVAGSRRLLGEKEVCREIRIALWDVQSALGVGCWGDISGCFGKA